jgi:ABC-2 type transport system ATP-binding protein
LEGDNDDEGLLIRARGLSKSFNAHVAVVNVSLTLRRGDVIGFVGPNGAGKTTTLRMLAGLVLPDVGSCEVFGRKLQRKDNSDIGYMPQKLALYGDLSVRENLRFRAEMYRLQNPRALVESALREFGLEDRQHLAAKQLSGGWARRLQLVAALIHRPSIVLLDEPTVGLDSQSRQDVWQRILLLATAGAGVIVNTHDLEEAEQCSRVVMFRSGHIVQQGPPPEIEAGAPIRAAFVKSGQPTPHFEFNLGIHDLLVAERHGRRWRIVTKSDRFDAVSDLIRAQGGEVFPDETRLSDVALLNEAHVDNPKENSR